MKESKDIPCFLIYVFCSIYFFVGFRKIVQNGQTEPDGVYRYSERFSLFIA